VEIAVLEVLRDWDNLVDVTDDAALRSVRDRITHGEIRPEKLAAASPTEPARTRDRLKTLFTDLALDEAASAVAPTRSAAAV
jgi:hypothetical protein